MNFRGSFQTVIRGVTFAIALGCEAPLAPNELRQLARAEARWAGRPFQSYAFEVRRSCFCPPVITEWARVEVTNGTISRVVVVETGAELRPEERSYFPRVEDVFESIRNAQNEKKPEWLADVVAQFDPALGYPSFVEFIQKPGIADAGSTYYLRRASALP